VFSCMLCQYFGKASESYSVLPAPGDEPACLSDVLYFLLMTSLRLLAGTKC